MPKRSRKANDKTVDVLESEIKNSAANDSNHDEMSTTPAQKQKRARKQRVDSQTSAVKPIHASGVSDNLDNNFDNNETLLEDKELVKMDENDDYNEVDDTSPTNMEVALQQPFVCRTMESLPEKLQYYWLQRYWFWSLYDHGIMMDAEGWYSVTPEKIARHIAERCRSSIIVDAFCGVGGNAIQFAFTCERVIAIDIDANRLQCARHNARIYGVEDRIEFIQGNYMELADSLKADVVFLSPPWGGPNYKASTTFDIDTMMPMNGTKLFQQTRKITHNIAYFLPKNTNLDQLAALSVPGETCEVEQALLRSKMKAITVYYGDLAYVEKEEYVDNT
ncbi:RNA cap guanine-N2 methyltransferase-domain-containing protein [Syncephalis fuscata]|nr:RNA cap guanine-N2 methyltransferase-domain-containing protein [Syncephalis fuscata]